MTQAAAATAMIEEARRLVAQGDVERALSFVASHESELADLRDEALLLRGRWHSVSRQSTMTAEQEQIYRDSVARGLLHLLDRLALRLGTAARPSNDPGVAARLADPVPRHAPADAGTDLFLSYAREDAAVAGRLVSDLAKAGLSVWYDAALSPGDWFHKRIEERIRGAAGVVVLWTTHSVRSRWVYSEASLADTLGTLIPVLCGVEAAQLPLPFASISCIRLDDMDRLIEAARAIKSARG